jgi:hypothetical protein
MYVIFIMFINVNDVGCEDDYSNCSCEEWQEGLAGC